MKIVVLAGGISTERDVSLVTGRGVYNALKSRGHEVILLDVYLGYDGDIDNIFALDKNWAAEVAPVSEKAPDIEEIKASRRPSGDGFFGANVLNICKMADIVFMGLHGENGENGKVQAVFDLMGIKYTGTGSLASALAMDKSITKLLFNQYDITTPEFYMLKDVNDSYIPKFPSVVKICNGGSSVGVYIVNDEKEYRDAVSNAFKYEAKVMVEQYIKGREFTCAVIDATALPVVEIAPVSGFYDYKNKYQAGATIDTCPAQISAELTARIQKTAVKASEALGISVYSRMDFKVSEDGEVYCLEANTLPGMTPTSLIPQEAEAIGKSYEELCEWIIDISLRK